MVTNTFSETLGYVLLIFGVVLIWIKFDWFIASIVAILIYGTMLALGGYILTLTEILLKGIESKNQQEK